MYKDIKKLEKVTNESLGAVHTHTHTHTHTGDLLNKRKIGLCKSNLDIVKDESQIEQKSYWKSAGITLIALVITIIVLLILAGVSIAMLTGNNGILTQAKLAKENTALAKEDEENKLAKNNEYINEQTGKVIPGKMATKTEKDNYIDGDGDKATIPEGFTVDEKENIISKGLVVHGPDKANGDNGSEFVWVPVPDINSMSQCSMAGGNCNLQLEDGVLKCTTHNSTDIVGKLYATEVGEKFGTENKTYNVDSGLREPAIVKSFDNNASFNTIGVTLSEMQESYKNMATNVARYGGFYVGRYETSLSNATASSAGTGGTAQSKQGVIPTSAENSATSSWYGLYSKQKEYTGKNGSVESSMIWGSQYDRILNWVKEGKNDEEKSKITNTKLGNNSSGSVAITGNSNYSNDSINNIRDLGGNLLEWPLEAYDTYGRVNRGGFFFATVSPCYRGGGSPDGTDSYFGSRFTLYIK